MTTNSESWADRLAARLRGPDPDAQPQPPATGPETSAWARVAADRAAGREPSAADVREAQERARRPRTRYERRVLARLGHDSDGGPTAA